jgi:hypothetical protein
MSATTIYGHDSFKSGTSFTDLYSGASPRWSSQNWSSGGGGTAQGLDATHGRFGGYCFRTYNTGNSAYLRKSSIGNQTTLCLNLPVNLIDDWANTGATSPVACFMDGGTVQCCVAVDQSSGEIKVYRGDINGTLLATSSYTVTYGTYFVLEFKVTFSTTVGSIEVRANGTSIIGPTGSLNTAASGNAYANGYQLGGSSASQNPDETIYYEHCICCDDFMGDMKFYCQTPNADSAVQWTPLTGTNVSQIDEAEQDGDTSYNSDGTAGDIDLFSFAATPTGMIGIFAVIASIWVEPGSTHTCATVVSSSGTIADGATGSNGTSYVEQIDKFYNDPHTSAPWTNSTTTRIRQHLGQSLAWTRP